jgi:hypothetical protein
MSFRLTGRKYTSVAVSGRARNLPSLCIAEFGVRYCHPNPTGLLMEGVITFWEMRVRLRSATFEPMHLEKPRREAVIMPIFRMIGWFVEFLVTPVRNPEKLTL